MARGTHGRQGLPPDPNSLRSALKGSDGWVSLPASRDGDPPVWPLADPSEREMTLWAGEWKRPQAVMWEQAGQQLEVAMYVRALVAAESRQATAAERVLVVRQQEYLGLSQPGLARNRWRIGEPTKAATTVDAGEARDVTTSARDRLRVVSKGA